MQEICIFCRPISFSGRTPLQAASYLVSESVSLVSLVNLSVCLSIKDVKQ